MRPPRSLAPVLGLILLLSLPLAGQARHDDWHRGVDWSATKDWTLRCGSRAARDNRCVAYTENDGLVGGVWGTANALSISANEPGRYRVGFDQRLYVPDGVHPLRLSVDGRFRRSLSAGKGYRGNEIDGYRIETNPALINAMKRGRELTISYVDVFGDERQAVFSLMGVTNSLRFMDRRLTPRAERKREVSSAPRPLLYRHK